MQSKPTFGDLIDRLTRDGVDWVEHDAGNQLHHRKGALLQLRETVFSGMESTGGSSSFGSRPPIDASALDLLEQITEQATEALALVYKAPTPFGHAEEYVRLWSGLVDSDQRVLVSLWRERELSTDELKQKPIPPRVFRKTVQTTAYDLAQLWLNSIEEFLNPAKLREIIGECPACGESVVHRRRDGEVVRATALSFVQDRTTGDTKQARCAACGATWAPETFDWLARVVGAAMNLTDLFEQYSDGDEHGWDVEFELLRKKHKKQLAKLRQSIIEHGIQRPILLGYDGRVWDGHHRLCVADELGFTAVPIKKVEEPKTDKPKQLELVHG